jgi:reactive chlorine resistance protein C
MTTEFIHSPRDVTESLLSTASGMRRLYIKAARLDRFGMGMLRLGLVIVLVWIGGLKFASYEADGIVPLVANSPFMSFLYHRPTPEYRQHLNKEGQVVPLNQQWNESNGTYQVSYDLGVIIVSLGMMIALYPIWPQVSAVGSLLLILMSLTTLSFLVTTPEAWVPGLGGPQHGFPYLSGTGRLVVQDFTMLGAAIVTMADAAKAYVRRSA